MQELIKNFIETTNAGDVAGALSLFAPDAIIDDVSVGDTFVGRDSVRLYLERFFVGYHTCSKLVSIKTIDDVHANVRLDFTGDFGHEVGTLKITLNADGLIARADADLD
ncbi:nuclear transport factor 2 family protein [Mesorhizobium erdmanii]|uniref:nuclear transport factor 2 family protein n=1 Tax=Mesorhizobium erdmanii TaxID=1777866 RepID=UPI000401594A|nr:nuclear transport factor 2 family protein [Mesorhizobium erdmanii]